MRKFLLLLTLVAPQCFATVITYELGYPGGYQLNAQAFEPSNETSAGDLVDFAISVTGTVVIDTEQQAITHFSFRAGDQAYGSAAPADFMPFVAESSTVQSLAGYKLWELGSNDDRDFHYNLPYFGISGPEFSVSIMFEYWYAPVGADPLFHLETGCWEGIAEIYTEELTYRFGDCLNLVSMSEPAEVPEPSTLALLSFGLAVTALRRRKTDKGL